jgi:hypothetical protein
LRISMTSSSFLFCSKLVCSTFLFPSRITFTSWRMAARISKLLQEKLCENTVCYKI